MVRNGVVVKLVELWRALGSHYSGVVAEVVSGRKIVAAEILFRYFRFSTSHPSGTVILRPVMEESAGTRNVCHHKVLIFRAKSVHTQKRYWLCMLALSVCAIIHFSENKYNECTL